MREISEEERALMRRWVETWKAVGPELEAIRRKEIRETNTVEALEALEDAFNHALRTLPMRKSSGLIEMQDVLAKLRPANR